MTWCLPAIHIGKTKQASTPGEPWPRPNATSYSSRAPISRALKGEQEETTVCGQFQKNKEKVGPKQLSPEKGKIEPECKEKKTG